MSSRIFIVAIALLALGAGVIAAIGSRPQTTEIPLSDLVLPDVNGQIQEFHQWQGKTVLLNFWATWCAPCREEIPLLKEAQKNYGERGLQVIGIAIDEISDVVAYNQQLKTNYPLLIGNLSTLSVMSRYGNQNGLLPYSLLIDDKGKVISQKIGAYKKAELQAILEGILPTPKPP